jgi:hypothetical protein
VQSILSPQFCGTSLEIYGSLPLTAATSRRQRRVAEKLRRLAEKLQRPPAVSGDFPQNCGEMPPRISGYFRDKTALHKN